MIISDITQSKRCNTNAAIFIWTLLFWDKLRENTTVIQNKSEGLADQSERTVANQENKLNNQVLFWGVLGLFKSLVTRHLPV